MISKELAEIQQILSSLAEKKSEDFFRKMVPGNQKIYGVKTPALNDIVKKYKHGSFRLAEELWKSGALEEKIIAIKIIEKKGKEDTKRLFELFQQFSKQIDNWAVCDGLGMQFLRGVVKTDPDTIFGIAKKYNHSKNLWQRRLSLVMVEWYTRDKKMHPAIKQLVKNLEDDDEYYVKKAVIWIKKNFKKGK
ncbi:MAG: DNA alkylation repair protein [Bacteroidota bacterium]